MSEAIKFTITGNCNNPLCNGECCEDGIFEQEHEIPARYVVCSDCKGKGSVLNEAIRHHGYSREEMEEAGPEFLEEYLKGGDGIHGVPCPTCNGLRVVLVPDEKQCNPEILKLYLGAQEEKSREEAQDRRTYLMECGIWE